MTAVSTTQATLIGRLWPQTSGNSVVRTAALILIGSALMAIAAHIQVPFWPVKLSMQSFVAIVIGMSYGSRLGGATILAYLVEGAAGLPVFQSGAGITYMAGPTGGFLLGFFLAAIVAGYFAERGALSRLPTALGAILMATVALYVPGIAWLAVLFGAEKSIAFGLTPFIPGELLKIGLALALTPAIRRFTR
ncbi:MAG: biotin transporter BioY [Afipia sp.]|nr:biotin transporter BioY [Afipia sp.]